MSATTPHTEDIPASSPPVVARVLLQSPVMRPRGCSGPGSGQHVVTEGEARNAGVRVPWLSGIHALSYSPSCSQAELMTVRVLTRTVTIVPTARRATAIKVLTHIFIRPSSCSSPRLVLGAEGVVRGGSLGWVGRMLATTTTTRRRRRREERERQQQHVLSYFTEQQLPRLFPQ